MRSLLKLLTQYSTRTTRDGKWTNAIPVPGNRWICPPNIDFISNSDPPVGGELEGSSRGQGDTWGPCWCHHQKEIDRSHCAQGPNQNGISARQLESPKRKLCSFWINCHNSIRIVANEFTLRHGVWPSCNNSCTLQSDSYTCDVNER